MSVASHEQASKRTSRGRPVSRSARAAPRVLRTATAPPIFWTARRRADPSRLDLSCLANHSRNKRFHSVGANILLHLNRDDFRRVHLAVKEFHRLGPARAGCCPTRTPFALSPARRLSPACCQNSSMSVSDPAVSAITCSGSLPSRSHRRTNSSRSCSSGPVHDAVRRVVEHLTNHLPPDPRVTRSLDFDESWDGILIQE